MTKLPLPRFFSNFKLSTLSLAITALSGIPSMAQTVEVTDRIALSGKISNATPHSQDDTRLILDNSGQNVYGVSDLDKQLDTYNDSTSFLWSRATHWGGTNYNTKTDLGTLRSDNKKSSAITAIAQDGKILAGRSKENRNHAGDAFHAGIWSETNYDNKADLGIDLPNWGTSAIYGLSDDGTVAVGRSFFDNLPVANSTTLGRATVWTAKDSQARIELGTLKTDNGGESRALAVSADGKVVVGISESDKVPSRATVWYGNGWTNKKDLDSLTNEAEFISRANTISKDGTIIGGMSHSGDKGLSTATLWMGDEWNTKIKLGSLDGQNLYDSEVNAISGDGKVAGGWSSNQNQEFRPIVWSGENYNVKTDLGTLAKNNRGSAIVSSFNQDGTIAAGFSEDETHNNGSWRPTVWKIEYVENNPTPPIVPTPPTNPPVVNPPVITPPTNPAPTPPVVTPPTNPPTVPTPPPVTPPAPTPTPVVVTKIDVANTAQTVNKLGQDSFTLMSMQSHALDRLQYSCVNYNGVCFGVQQDVSLAKDKEGNKHRDVAMGVNVGYGFGNGLSAGVSLDHSINRKLPDSYRHSDDNVGVGAVVRYHSPKGYFGEISGVYDKYAVTITRPTLANTEIGVNDADIKGTAYGLKVGKNFGNQNKHRAYVGVKHRDISRGAYTENEQTDFPISYGEMSYKNTALTVGASTNVALTNKLSWVSDVQVERHLSGDDPVYTASLTGVDKYEFSHTSTPAKTQGYVATGISYKVVPQTRIEVMPYVNKNANGEHGGGAVFRIETAF